MHLSIYLYVNIYICICVCDNFASGCVNEDCVGSYRGLNKSQVVY